MESADENTTGASKSTFLRTMREAAGGVRSGSGVRTIMDESTGRPRKLPAPAADAATLSRVIAATGCNPSVSVPGTAYTATAGPATRAAKKPMVKRRIKCIIAAKLQKLFGNYAIACDKFSPHAFFETAYFNTSATDGVAGRDGRPHAQGM